MNKVYLRSIEDGDAIILYNYICKPEDNPFSNFENPFLLDDSKKMFKKMKDSNPNKFQSLIICDSASHQPIGFISLMIDKINVNAEIGLWIAKEYRNKGNGKEAMKLMGIHAFNVLNLELLHCCINETNLPSINLMKSQGYVFESKLRKRHFYENKFMDGMSFSLTKDEFNK